MRVHFSYISSENGEKYSFSCDVQELIADYYDEAKYFASNESKVLTCILDNENILPKTGWTIEKMMEEIEKRTE